MGVHRLHQAGLIHGELRPENILCSKAGATDVTAWPTPGSGTFSMTTTGGVWTSLHSAAEPEVLSQGLALVLQGLVIVTYESVTSRL